MNKTLKSVSIMIRASNTLQEVLKKDISCYKLNPAEFGVLEYLYHKNEQQIIQICDKLLMPNSSMTYVIDKLESKDLVQRKVNDDDKRSTLIELTDKGKKLFDEIFPKHELKINEIFSVLSDEEIETLNTLLKKVGYNCKNIIEKES